MTIKESIIQPIESSQSHSKWNKVKGTPPTFTWNKFSAKSVWAEKLNLNVKCELIMQSPLSYQHKTNRSSKLYKT